MRYTTLLFDLDNTLFDASSCEPAAFEYALASGGVTDPARHWDTFTELNDALWAAVVRQELTPNEVQGRRFADLVAAAGLEVDPVRLADEYVVGMGAYGDLYPGALEVLDELGRRVALGLVTNGLGEVVRARIDRLELEPLFDAIVISGEVGVSKPSEAIFDLAFAALGQPDKASVLMIGDSLSSDIAGAANYGIAACWYNPSAKPHPDGVRIDHEITSLEELPELAATGIVG
jgi:YjjG family noncanonical pyrimidine nucleotidase